MFEGIENDLPFEREKEVLAKIGKYNAGDVVTSARVYAKLKGYAAIPDEKIKFIQE